MTVLDLMKSDIKNYAEKIEIANIGPLKLFRLIFLTPGLQLALAIRIQNALGRVAIVGVFLRRVLNYWISIYFSCDIDPKASFGSAIYFPHPNGIVIGGEWDIGDNVTILHRVTLGRINTPTHRCRIGNHVFVGSGACIIGQISIGDNAKIGSNAVVINDVPQAATAVGVPARILVRDHLC